MILLPKRRKHTSESKPTMPLVRTKNLEFVFIGIFSAARETFLVYETEMLGKRAGKYHREYYTFSQLRDFACFADLWKSVETWMSVKVRWLNGLKVLNQSVGSNNVSLQTRVKKLLWNEVSTCPLLRWTFLAYNVVMCNSVEWRSDEMRYIYCLMPLWDGPYDIRISVFLMKLTYIIIKNYYDYHYYILSHNLLVPLVALLSQSYTPINTDMWILKRAPDLPRIALSYSTDV